MTLTPPERLEATRQAAHVLLDMAGVWHQADGQTALAGQRLQEVDAVISTRNDETGTSTLHMAPVVDAMMALLTWNLDALARQSGRDQVALVVALREQVDEWIASVGDS